MISGIAARNDFTVEAMDVYNAYLYENTDYIDLL